MKKYPIPAAISYSQQTEDLLRMNVTKSIAQLTEAEIYNLLQDIERNKVELKLQNEELKQAKEQATIAANKYIELYDFAPTGYFALTKNGEITELNYAGAKMLGDDRSKFINKRFGLFVSEETKPVFNHFLEKVFSSNANETCKATLATDGNPLMYLQLNGIHSQSEELCFVTAVNITESMLAEEKLLAEQAFRNSIETSLFSGIAIVDDEGRQTYVNPYFCKLFGWSAEELTGKTTPFVYWPADQLQAIGEAFQQTLAGMAPTEGFELVFIRKDGIRIPVNVIISPFNDGKKRIGWLANVMNITKRKNAEEALKESQQRLSESQKLAHIGVWDWNAATDSVIWSDELYSIAGMDPKLPAPTFAEHPKIFTPQSWLILKNAVENSMKTSKSYTLELEQVRPDGSIRNIKAFGGAKFDAMGQVTGLFGTLQDITELKEAEKAIQTEKRNFQSVFESSPVPLLVIDETTNIIMVNQAAIKVCGGTASEILQHRPGNALHCVHSSKDPRGCGYANDCKLCIVRNSIERLIAEGGSLDGADVELELYRKGKSQKVWITVGVEPLLINGKDHWCIAMSDITDRKNAEETTYLSEQKLKSYFDNAGDAIYVVESETGKIINCNTQACIDLGYQTEELLKLSTFDIEVEIPQNTIVEIHQLADSKNIKTITGQHKRKDGTTFPVEIRMSVLPASQPKLLVAFVRNISERKIAEQEIRQKNEDLQKLNATKDKFFSIIAHDLRSPFNGILGFSNILVDQIQEKNYEGIEEYALVVQKSAQRALSLLINLLDWSRSQIGLVKFSPEYVEIGLLIKDVVELFVDIAHQKKIELSIELPSKVIAFGDKEMLNTILRNLVSNAIKFSLPGGTVIISVEVQPNEFTISVSDTGVGISKARIDKLFQIDQSNHTIGTQNEQGTGLGLILCKEFVEKHRGKIWIESEVGDLPAGKTGGSTIYFTLPRSTMPSAEDRILQKI